MKFGLVPILWLSLATTAGMIAFGQVAGNATSQAQSAVIRITSPLQESRQTATFVDVHYELTNPTAAASTTPNFKIQLDDRDPIITATTDQNFTGLTPGRHVITLQLVDANGTVIPSSETQVEFNVIPTAQNGAGTTPPSSNSNSTQTTTPVPQAASAAGEATIPPARAGVSLPFISIIGFGVLVGGIATTVRTRSINRR